MSDDDPSELIDKYETADELLTEIQESLEKLAESGISDEDVAAQYRLVKQIIGMIQRQERYGYQAHNIAQAAYYDNNY